MLSENVLPEPICTTFTSPLWDCIVVIVTCSKRAVATCVAPADGTDCAVDGPICIGVFTLDAEAWTGVETGAKGALTDVPAGGVAVAAADASTGAFGADTVGALTGATTGGVAITAGVVAGDVTAAIGVVVGGVGAVRLGAVTGAIVSTLGAVSVGETTGVIVSGAGTATVGAVTGTIVGVVGAPTVGSATGVIVGGVAATTGVIVGGDAPTIGAIADDVGAAGATTCWSCTLAG
jgi:hypothetical protein